MREREGANRNAHRKNPKTGLETCTQQHMIFADKKGKKIIVTPGKAQSTGEKLTWNEFKRKTKEGEQKKRKNGKAAQQKPQQENKAATTASLFRIAKII